MFLGDEQTVDQTQQEANAHHDEHDQRPRHPAIGYEVDENDAKQRNDRACGQIDATSNDHQSLGNRKHAKEADKIGCVCDVDW